jgi:hypothetical protein
MITQLKETEWMVEPDIEGAREYARLHIKATKTGLNIDGQGTIRWDDLLAYKIRVSIKQAKANHGS